MNLRRAIGAALLAAALSLLATTVLATAAPAAPPPGKGKPPKPTPTPTPTATPAPPQVNPADAEFVSMMIPHHYQALVMSRMGPTRSSDQEVLALAGQIDVEQGLEITMMQAWQSWNGLQVTDAEMAYNMMLQDPMMLEHMGMASPAQMAALSASQGTDFDVLYLQLMIRHHQGALGMLVDVLTNGSDVILAEWANEMYMTQLVQINWMQAMLDSKT